jgi:release factor glutamine methyltransferase
VPSATVRELLRDGRSEPLLALDGGEDGLDCIRRLICDARAYLASGGYFLLECGEYNIAQARTELVEHGFTDIMEYTDLGGKPRLLRGKMVGIINLAFSATHPRQTQGVKPEKSMRGILKGKGIMRTEFEKMQRKDLLLEEGR